MNFAVVNRFFLAIAIAAWAVGAPFTARADVKFNSLFSDGAVLQQGVAVPVWGTASEGEEVTVKFQEQTVTATAKEGRWLVRLKPLKPGGPYTLSASGETKSNLSVASNVLVGEVWLCSGQSNMAFPLSRATNAAEAVAAARDSQLRLLTVPRAALDALATDAPVGWEESTPETAAKFSAVAWFFGRELRKTLRVPVGLINSSVGGTPAEAWTSRATLEADPELKQALERYADSVKN